MSISRTMFQTTEALAKNYGRQACECEQTPCPVCGGSRIVEQKDHSAWMVAFLSAASVEQAAMMFDAGDVANGVELVAIARDYVAEARRIEMEHSSEDELAAVLQTVAHVMNHGSGDAHPTDTARTGMLTPQEIHDLIGAPVEGTIKCHGCGDYTFGIEQDPRLPHLEHWCVNGKYAVCSSDRCIALWDAALDAVSDVKTRS